MSKKLKPKVTMSEDILSTKSYDKEVLDNNINNSFQSPYEIFRNNTTVIEVIAKEIKHKGKKKIILNGQKCKAENFTNNRLKEDIEKLRGELHNANSNLDEARKCFNVILYEMKKQLEGANQRELETQTKNLALQLENEKLRILLESKSTLVTKLKKELLGMRGILKVVLKGIRFVLPSPDNAYHLDLNYDEFKKNLNNSAFNEVTENSLFKKTL